MGFWDVVSHFIGTVMDCSMKKADRNAEKAERAYESGKINDEQYDEILNNRDSIESAYNQYRHFFNNSDNEEN